MADLVLEEPRAEIPDKTKPLAQRSKEKHDNLSLDSLWPEPDWRRLVKGGMSADVAAAIAILREGLAAQPRSEAVEWREAYRSAVPMIRDLLLSSSSVEDAVNLNERLESKLGGRFSFIFWAAGHGTKRYRAPCHRSLRQAALIRCCLNWAGPNRIWQ